MAADPRRAAIIGLGLIGGSIARDLAQAGMVVAAYDDSVRALDAAHDEGVIAEKLDQSLAGLEAAEIVVVAVPVSATEAVLRSAANRLSGSALIMDVGSTKRGAIAAAESAGIGDRFVGAHPMTGDHRAGWSASRRGLFADAIVYLCATRATRDDAMVRARAFWTSLGARACAIGAREHDVMVARTSHAPHMVSAALALAMPDGVPRDAIGPGGRDALRLAAGSVDVWTAIAMENADALAVSLADVREAIDRFGRALQQRDEPALRALLAAAGERVADLVGGDERRDG